MENETNITTELNPEIEKLVQSETDKVRTEYVKKVKALEEKVSELTPKEKSPIEIENEDLKAQLRKRDLENGLIQHGLNKDLINFLDVNVDLEKFVELFGKSETYIPNNHTPHQGMTQKELSKLNYSERLKLYEQNPLIIEKFKNRK